MINNTMTTNSFLAKYVLFCFVVFSLLCSTSCKTKKLVKENLEEINSLEKTDCFVDSGVVPFYWLTEDQLEPHLKSNNPYTQLYALNAFYRKFPEQINTFKPAEIFNNQNKAFGCFYGKRVDLGMSIGQLAQEFWIGQEHGILKEGKIDEVRGSIKRFILNYANDSNSYKPLIFDERSYTWTDDAYRITHTYKLKNRSGELIEESKIFTLNLNMEIELIETIKTNSWRELPRTRVLKWLEQYGRDLSDEEKTLLKLVYFPSE